MNLSRNVKRFYMELDVVIEHLRKKAEKKEMFETEKGKIPFVIIEMSFRRLREDVAKLQIQEKLSKDAKLARFAAAAVMFGRDLLIERNDRPCAKRLVEAYNSVSQLTLEYESGELDSSKFYRWVAMDADQWGPIPSSK